MRPSSLVEALVDLNLLDDARAALWRGRLFGPSPPGTAPWDPWLDAEWRGASRDTFEQIADYYDSDPHVVFQAAQLPDWETVQLSDDLARVIGAGAEVLDFGCGSGRIGAGFVNAGCQVTFCDVSERLLAGLQHLARAHGCEVSTWRPGEGEAFPVGRFDLVAAGDVLEHVRAPDAVLRSLVAALKPGGHLWQHVFFGGHELSPYHLPENFHFGVPGAWDDVSRSLGLSPTGVEGLWRLG